MLFLHFFSTCSDLIFLHFNIFELYNMLVKLLLSFSYTDIAFKQARFQLQPDMMTVILKYYMLWTFFLILKTRPSILF